jgi:hypothetical protein
VPLTNAVHLWRRTTPSRAFFYPRRSLCWAGRPSILLRSSHTRLPHSLKPCIMTTRHRYHHHHHRRRRRRRSRHRHYHYHRHPVGIILPWSYRHHLSAVEAQSLYATPSHQRSRVSRTSGGSMTWRPGESNVIRTRSGYSRYVYMQHQVIRCLSSTTKGFTDLGWVDAADVDGDDVAAGGIERQQHKVLKHQVIVPPPRGRHRHVGRRRLQEQHIVSRRLCRPNDSVLHTKALHQQRRRTIRDTARHDHSGVCTPIVTGGHIVSQLLRQGSALLWYIYTAY